MAEGINVLSLFNGYSGGEIALHRAGIKVNKYYASEIDPYANRVTSRNYPDTIHLGDIRTCNFWKIDWGSIDLVIGGSPCQGFSFAGKQLALDDPRSKLFFIYVYILNKVKAANKNVKFMLENVPMKKESEKVISKYLGVEPIMINSALVSAQNRRRLYWANWGFGQPEDKSIFLKDIIEHGAVDRDKSYCLDASYFKGGNLKQYFEKNRRQLVFCGALRGRQIYKDSDEWVQQMELRHDGKTNTISTVAKDNNVVVFEAFAFTERRTEEAKKIRKEYREKHGRDFSPRRGKELVPRTDGKMNCLTATYSLKEHTLADEKAYYRKLTPTECERLQTLPDGYTEGEPNTERYRMLGNGWNVDTIAHIFRSMNA